MPNNQPLFYQITGPEVLKENIPLYEVLSSLREYMTILDRSYLTIINKNRLTKREREKYKIIAYRFQPGSLNVDISIQLIDIIRISAPILFSTGLIGTEDIWNLAKSSYNFLKLMAQAKNNNEKLIIKENKDVKNIDIDGNNVSIHPNVLLNSEKIENSVITITNLIQGGSVENISIQDEKREGIVITEKEKKLFNPSTKIDENPQSMRVNIYRLDKETKQGKLHILENIKITDVPFQIIGNQSIELYIDALKSNQVEITALKELATNISGDEYIARLQIINLPNISPKQKDLF